MADSRRNSRQNHIALAQQVIGVVLERGMSPGDHLPEQAFSEACGVSRTPIRAAFKILEEKEILTWKEEEGYFLEIGQADGLTEEAHRLEDMEDSLAQRILSDRADRRIGDIQSISALVRRYNVTRNSVLNALKILSRDGVVTQLPGRSWAFQPMFDTPKAVDESLAFRLTIEPQAILAPGFIMDIKKAGLLKMRMQELLDTQEGHITSTGFLRLDTEFHSFIAECSGNRFARGALLAHHRLRRATQKDISIPDFRLRQSLDEHLEILDSLERHQFELAADQMVLHLRRSRIRRPEAANRGIPPLMRGARQ
ncbi:GntR family transcriptional regulator [Aidingimonas halophila]|uniref:DNA-binding transcriptional regulator, GntR family n=1 Tax=Aidingimonas halophila TaxID=574349 RepID=A0A1H2Q9Y9_9GAMM|nr:GntR family transcriptional regulator [Aidingimonas halophila]GHC21010.1 GntR family transcriptional regulator [Aidingimonas halophila]SDW03494.1 DNA-binding transcriptional regulator, GntR family [Aidingimonas halophila]